MNNYDIFSFINKDDNDNLFNMTINEKKELLKLINMYFLEYRNIINLNNSVTFGVELEFENGNYKKVKKEIKKVKDVRKWILEKDISVETGGELKTPILKDNKWSWDKLSIYCKILQNEAEIDTYAGTHIHFGANILKMKEENIKTILKLWYIYENIIFRFAYGEFLNSRKLLKGYAYPIREYYLNIINYTNEEDFFDSVRLNRYRAINFRRVEFSHYKKDNTIEVRCPNGTLNEIVVQNNVNFFAKFLEFATSNKCDDEKLNYLINQIGDNRDMVGFYLLDVNKSLELVDLIFDNNLDKIYFLRQYLKDFEQSIEYKKSKKFTM